MNKPRTIAIALFSLTAALLGPVPSAVAGASLTVPSADNSTVDKVIHLVGASSGILSTSVGDFTVIVRDLAGQPIANSSVVLDFSLCGTSDVRIASSQLQSGVSMNCAAKDVLGVCDGAGRFTFKVMGNSQNSGGASGLAVPCMRVYADGVLLDSHQTGVFAGNRAVIVAPYDETGSGGFDALDLAAFVGDLFHAPATYYARSDFDGSGSITPLDLSMQVGAMFAGSWTQTAAGCP
jgi:hypothetical protein